MTDDGSARRSANRARLRSTPPARSTGFGRLARLARDVTQSSGHDGVRAQGPGRAAGGAQAAADRRARQGRQRGAHPVPARFLHRLCVRHAACGHQDNPRARPAPFQGRRGSFSVGTAPGEPARNRQDPDRRLPSPRQRHLVRRGDGRGEAVGAAHAAPGRTARQADQNNQEEAQEVEGDRGQAQEDGRQRTRVEREGGPGGRLVGDAAGDLLLLARGNLVAPVRVPQAGQAVAASADRDALPFLLARPAHPRPGRARHGGPRQRSGDHEEDAETVSHARPDPVLPRARARHRHPSRARQIRAKEAQVALGLGRRHPLPAQLLAHHVLLVLPARPSPTILRPVRPSSLSQPKTS